MCVDFVLSTHDHVNLLLHPQSFRAPVIPVEPEKRDLYPPIEPSDTGYLPVGDNHELYYEISGNPDGLAALFLHGGPGSGCGAHTRRFFDPDFYRIVCFDQVNTLPSIGLARLM